MNDVLTKDKLTQYLTHLGQEVALNSSVAHIGIVKRIVGMKVEVSGLSLSLGTLCNIAIGDHAWCKAEVIGFSGNRMYLMALQDTSGVKPGAAVAPLTHGMRAPIGGAMLGRILDAYGEPIDGKGPLLVECSSGHKVINPLHRKRINTPLDVGIRAINALLTVGKGQRVGIFAGSGVGKSVLLGMMTRNTTADIVIVGLIGERGREVKEFIEESLGEAGLRKSVVIAAPADTSPLLRVHGAALAATLAEYYRDQGLDVLLIVDSLTRYAHAQREISLAAGELPATKGFTPTVFAKLAQYVERSGNGTEAGGSITAFYTVLVEGDDHQDPIADHVRSILDGHIFLSRQLAESGHYPAIDIERSISRVMPAVVAPLQIQNANRFKRNYTAYQKNKDLINIGMYQRGADRVIDEAIHYREAMEQFMQQGMFETSGLAENINQLNHFFNGA